MPLQGENKALDYRFYLIYDKIDINHYQCAPSHHFHCHIACPVKIETTGTSDAVLSPKLQQIEFFIITICYNCQTLQLAV